MVKVSPAPPVAAPVKEMKLLGLLSANSARQLMAETSVMFMVRLVLEANLVTLIALLTTSSETTAIVSDSLQDTLKVEKSLHPSALLSNVIVLSSAIGMSRRGQHADKLALLIIIISPVTISKFSSPTKEVMFVYSSLRSPRISFREERPSKVVTLSPRRVILP